MDERDVKRLAIAGGVGLFVFWVLNSAYNAGLSAGLASDGEGGYGVRHGFFPFPPFLLIFGGIALFIYLKRRGHIGGPGPSDRGRGRGGPPRFFEDWHRQAHQDDDSQPPAPAQMPPSGGPDRPTETSML